MLGVDSPSRAARLPSRQKPALVMAVAGILAFVIWTLPNWGEFWMNVWQFPSLWQIPTNRWIIISLIVKVASPLLIIGIIGIMLWIYSLIKASLGEEGTDNVRLEQVPQGVSAEKRVPLSTSSSMGEQTSETRYVSLAVPLRSQPAPVMSRSNPETPLPPTLSLAGEANRSVFFPKNEQPVLLTGQKEEKNPIETNQTFAPALQRADHASPLPWGSELLAASEPLISLRLLKDVSMMINVPGGGHIVVPLTLNARRVQLLAYIAWRRGELIERDKILEHVFGWGLSDEEATEDKLSERFESHKKLLRRKIREVIIEQINKPEGRQLIDPDLVDPFVSDSGFWGLSDICRVEDLDAIEADYKVIALARKDGKLVDEIPDYVKESCERLIANYPGDFLESLLKRFPGEFRAWQGRSSWVRKPFTRYRDYYLDALWYAAEYDWRMGQRYGEGEAAMEEENQRTQQEHFGRAAQKYQSYAMYACNSKFDAKATFSAHGEFGERVGMSERALRRCVVLWGAIGRTDLVNQVWSAYSTQMRSISDQRWQPSQETQADVQAARAQTNAYRFAAQVSQTSESPES